MSWTFDQARRAWICTQYSDLHYAAINNLAEYGQPFSPYEQGFDQEFEPDFGNIIVEMSQQEVMSNGYGKMITANNFPIVRRFLWEKLALHFGTYSFDALVRHGVARSTDKWIKSNLYGMGDYGITAGNLNAGDAAYIHGTVSFALMSGTRFVYAQSLRRVDAEIGAGDDNWDFHSSTIPGPLNALGATLLGPDHYNLTAPIRINFRGIGKHSSIEQRTTSWSMFRYFTRP